ncbi:MAG TPA: tripartite tricarboxylate transporter substrate binding protein, partial [Thermodesulfobacteriota bacterium]|nr:tripartite tricarboxylate transporter substrate binding protein [Thermodesulfobacteriota bacterium]
MKKSLLLFLCAVLTLALIIPDRNVYAQSKWKPTRPVTVVVPWPPGGASDTTGRMIAGQMESILGERMVIVNTPGGAGAIGTKEVWDRPHDGYTLTANATVSIVSYALLGRMDQTYRDWIYFLPMYTPNVVAVKNDSPLKSMEDLLAAMKARPGAVTVATAGVGSSGYFFMELFKAAAGITYRHVPYAGGAPAVVAAASGEAEVVTQLSIEAAELLRSKKLRALGVSTKDPLEIEGYGVIPSITKAVPKFEEYGSYFGLMGPRDLPKDVVAALEEAFQKAAATKAVKDYAKTKGGISISISGAKASELVDRLARREAWILYEAGAAAKSPADFNIP